MKVAYWMATAILSCNVLAIALSTAIRGGGVLEYLNILGAVMFGYWIRLSNEPST